MSAAFLREAAALMRERAEKSYPSPWRATESCVWADRNDDEFPMADVNGGVYRNIENTASHIASWHPAVALVVADWLDVVAARYDDILGNFAEGSRAGAVTAAENVDGWHQSLAVAAAYLGRQP